MTAVRVEHTENPCGRRFFLEPEAFREVLENNPDSSIVIVDAVGKELRTFPVRPLVDFLKSNPTFESGTFRQAEPEAVLSV